MAKASLTVEFTDTNVGEDGYEIQISTDSRAMVTHEYNKAHRRGWMNIGAAPADAGSYTFDIELPYTYCYVRTRAIKDGHVPGPWTPEEGALYSTVAEGTQLSAPTNVRVIPAVGEIGSPPASVTDLTAAAGGSNPNSTIRVQFTAVDDGLGQPAKFDVRYSTTADFPFNSGTSPGAGTAQNPSQPSNIGDAVSVDIEGLTPGTTYYVKVQSYRGTLGTNAVLGGISNEDPGTTSGGQPSVLSAPQNLDPSQETVAAGTVNFSWDAVASASGYALRVHIQGNPYLPQDSSNYVYFGTLTETNIDLTLVAGKSYDWWIHAYDSSGFLGDAAGTVVTCQAVAPTNPTVSSLAPAPATVSVDNIQVMTVTLSNTYPSDITVALTNTDSSKLTVPSSVVVPANSLTATFTALGVAAGSSTVTASYNSSSAQSSVTVSAVPSQGGSFPNQPASHTVKTDWGFPSLAGSGWVDAYNGNSLITLVSSDGPVSAPGALQCRFPVGHQGGYGVGNINYQFSPGAIEMYVGMYIKIQSPFQNHANMNKLYYIHSQFQSQHPFFLGVVGQGSTLRLDIVAQGDSTLDNRHLNGATGFFPFLGTGTLFASTTNFPVGSWVRVEVLVRESTTVSSRNGICRWWVNGQLTGNFTNLNTKQFGGFMGVIVNPVFGGGAESTKTQEDKIFFDHCRITGGN